jgi:hypothetical protein
MALPFAISIYLDALDGTNGFTVNSDRYNSFNGFSVSGAGDINNDGIGDIIIGCWGAGNDQSPNNQAGQSYIIFGHKESWPAIINSVDLNGVNGFNLQGINGGDHSGRFVSGVGDINNDGVDDVAIGASGANNDAGQVYIIYDSNRGSYWPPNLMLAVLRMVLDSFLMVLR